MATCFQPFLIAGTRSFPRRSNVNYKRHRASLSMTMEFKHVRPCKSTAAIEIIPAGKPSIELEAFIGELEAAGVEIVADAGVMLVLKLPGGSRAGGAVDGLELSLFSNGKMVVKSGDIEKAAYAGRFIYDVLGM